MEMATTAATAEAFIVTTMTSGDSANVTAVTTLIPFLITTLDVASSSSSPFSSFSSSFSPFSFSSSPSSFPPSSSSSSWLEAQGPLEADWAAAGEGEAGDEADWTVIVTLAQRQQASEVLLWLLYAVTLLAVPLTLCNMAVFLHPNMRSATAVYVLGMSLAQLVHGATPALHALTLHLVPSPTRSLAYWVIRNYVMVYGGTAARRGSYVIMCLVSLERLYAIARPLHVKGFFLSRRPVLCTALVYLISYVWHTYLLFKRGIGTFIDQDTGEVYHKPFMRDSYKESPEVNDFFSTAAKVVMTYVGLSAQIVLNLLTIWFLRRHNAKSKHMSSSTISALASGNQAPPSTSKEDVKRRRERQLTVTVLGTTFCYALLSLPAALHNISKNVFPDDYAARGRYTNLHHVVEYVALELTILSCAVDFVCFLALSSNYRATLRKMLRCGKPLASMSSRDSFVSTQTHVDSNSV